MPPKFKSLRIFLIMLIIFATGLLCTPFLEHEAQATLVKVKLIGL